MNIQTVRSLAHSIECAYECVFNFNYTCKFYVENLLAKKNYRIKTKNSIENTAKEIKSRQEQNLQKKYKKKSHTEKFRMVNIKCVTMRQQICILIFIFFFLNYCDMVQIQVPKGMKYSMQMVPKVLTSIWAKVKKPKFLVFRFGVY